MTDPLPDLKQQIQSLCLEHQRSLLEWLQSLVEGQEVIPVREGRQVVATQLRGQTTYRQELVRCGKEGCKCAEGNLHGPYWYAYYRQGGKMHSAYVGKSLKGTGDREN